jgi:hypothetical protein
MAWRVTVRRGPDVKRTRCDSLDEALDLLEERARKIAAGTRLAAIDLQVRHYAPRDQIAARAELRGPQRLRPDVHAGLDVRGDGSVVAWTGGIRREALEERLDENAYATLRRALQSTSVEP